MTIMIGYYSGKSEVVHLKRQRWCIALRLPVQLRANNHLMEEVPKHELVSKEFDAPKEAPKKEKKKYIPPMNHPWRKDSFANYAAKQKHRCGNVIKLIMLEFKSDDISADILF